VTREACDEGSAARCANYRPRWCVGDRSVELAVAYFGHDPSDEASEFPALEREYRRIESLRGFCKG
jgi:hypothetical protein